MTELHTIIVRHGKSIARKLAAQAALSGTVMLGFQLVLGVSLLPLGETKGTMVNPGRAFADVAVVAEAKPIVTTQGGSARSSKSGRLETPARQTALEIALRERVGEMRVANDSSPPIRLTAWPEREADETVLFGDCLPLCESRDPLLVRVAAVSTANTSRAIAPPTTPVGPSFEPLSGAYPSKDDDREGVLRTVGSGVAAVGSGTVSAVVGTVRWLAASVPLSTSEILQDGKANLLPQPPTR